MGPGYANTTTNLQIVLNTPPPPKKNPFLTRATQNNPRIKNFKTPQNPPSTPLGLTLALTEHCGNLATVYWNEKTLGTRKRTNDVINFRLGQTNKQETRELLLSAHKLLGSHCAVEQLEGWFKFRSFKRAGKRSCLCYLAVFINENDLLIAQF